MRSGRARVAGTVLAAVGLLGGLAGCGDDGDGDATASDDASLRPLAGRTLVVTGATEGGEPRDLVAGSEIRLAFAESTVSITAGCNTMNGTYTTEDDQLVVGQLATTQMACPEPLMKQDTWLAEVLAAPLTVTDGELSGADVVLRVADREEISPDRELTGQRWALESLIAADAVSSVGVEAWLEYDGTTLALDTGCNTGRATATLAGETLTLGPLMLTKRACPDALGREVEAAIVATLDGEVGVRIEEARLTLSNASSGTGLGLVAQ